MVLPIDYTAEYLYELIVLEYGEMEVLYNNTETFHRAVSLFWEKHTPVYNALEATNNLDYNPLDDQSHTVHRLGKGDNTAHSDGTGTGDRAAYNSSSYAPVAKTTDIQNSNGDWKDDITVTTTGLSRHSYQDLIEQQRNVVNFHVDDYILRDWAKELMVAVW